MNAAHYRYAPRNSSIHLLFIYSIHLLFSSKGSQTPVRFIYQVHIIFEHTLTQSFLPTSLGLVPGSIFLFSSGRW